MLCVSRNSIPYADGQGAVSTRCRPGVERTCTCRPERWWMCERTDGEKHVRQDGKGARDMTGTHPRIIKNKTQGRESVRVHIPRPTPHIPTQRMISTAVGGRGATTGVRREKKEGDTGDPADIAGKAPTMTGHTHHDGGHERICRQLRELGLDRAAGRRARIGCRLQPGVREAAARLLVLPAVPDRDGRAAVERREVHRDFAVARAERDRELDPGLGA